MKVLENSVIKLRNLEPDDIDFLYQTENKIDLWEISNTAKPYSKYTLQKYIKNSHLDIFTVKQVRFIIEDVKEHKIIGLSELFDYDPIHMRAGIGIYIINSKQRKKYGENTIHVLIDYCKTILRLNQIYCDIGSDNIASINLFEKVGFKLSGTKRQWLNTANGFKDVLFYQLIL